VLLGLYKVGGVCAICLGILYLFLGRMVQFGILGHSVGGMRRLMPAPGLFRRLARSTRRRAVIRRQAPVC
jgi:hypothetical protein